MRKGSESLQIDGVLLLDKPRGPSSNAVLQHSKRIFGARRAGHTGTLDPMATGLLPVCFGEATKFGACLLDSDKGYVASLVLGVRTRSGDAEGEVVERAPVAVTAGQMEETLALFQGEIEQVPPMYSAIKKDGRPLYNFARRGLEIDRPPRKVVIHRIELRNFDGMSACIFVRCSKGTYIRALADDVGSKLGCGAHIAALRRVEIGNFDVSEAISLERLQTMQAQERMRLLLPVDRLVLDLPRLQLSVEASLRFAQGQEIPIPAGIVLPMKSRARVYASSGQFLGLGKATSASRLRASRVLASLQQNGLTNTTMPWRSD
jgi:tRNA pseudouridine55 synthase